MKIFPIRYEKRLLSILILLLISASLNVFNVNISSVSAVPVSPYIAVVPEKTIDSTMTVGMNYTISLYTNYDGSDIWAWQFSLTFNPDILHLYNHTKTDTWTGDNTTKIFYATKTPVISDSEKVYVNHILMNKTISGQPPKNYTIDYTSGRISFTKAPSLGAEVKAIYMYGVVNGDLVTTSKGSIIFISGKFDNTEGKLSLTGANFRYSSPPPPTTKGPGILANVTFTVVGTGYSNITLGNDTQLIGVENPAIPTFYKIIDAATMPDHIGHGYFDNIPNVHDVAVNKLIIPTAAMLGDLVAINVTVRNEGNFTENFDVTVYANTTTIDTQTANLNRVTETTLTFSWNTTGVLGGSYIINATALLPNDSDLSDNSKTASITILFHDVAVRSVKASYIEVMAGVPVPINVTVANEGDFTETFTVTTFVNTTEIGTQPVISLAPHNKKIITLTWDTTGFSLGTYTINAVASSVTNETNMGNNVNNSTIIIAPYNTVSYLIEVGGVTFYVATKSNTIVSKLSFISAEKKISFIVTGEEGTRGFCNVTIPKNLLNAPLDEWNVTVDGEPMIPPQLVATENATHTFLNLSYNLSTRNVEIFGTTAATPPVVIFSYSPPTYPLVGEKMAFDASASRDPDGTIVSYAWDFGDGTKEIYMGANNNTATHTYTKARSYTVKLEVTDNEGLRNATQVSVTVYRHDVAIVSVAPNKTEVTIGETLSISVIVKNEGNFTENFTVTAYANTTAIETPIPVTDLAPGAFKPLTFTWNTTNVNPSTYTIKANATIVEGETETDDNEKMFDGTVTVNKLPSTISITISPASIKVSESTTISGSIKPTRARVNVTILYRLNAGTWDTLKNVTTDDNSTYSYTWTLETAGTYKVKARWEGDTNTLLAESNAETLYVKVPPIASFTYSPSIPTISDTVTFTSNSTDPDGVIVSRKWDFNGDGVIDATTEIATWAYYAAGTHTVILAVTDNDGLTDTITRLITVNVPATGHIDGIVRDTSTGSPIEGANVTADGHSVLTSVDGSYSIELQPGTYTITVSAHGYEDYSQTNVIVNAGESTTVNFELTPVQPANISLYIVLAVAAIIIIAGIAVYLFKAKKTA